MKNEPIQVWGFHTYHAVYLGEKYTVCGRPITNMEYQGTDLEDIECKQCLRILVIEPE